MELYTDEKILPESFSRAVVIEGLIKQVEELYTTHFGRPHLCRSRKHADIG
jgi:hypothetical protein